MKRFHASFKTMGTDVSIVAWSELDLEVVRSIFSKIQLEFLRINDTYTRFNNNSLLSTINVKAQENWIEITSEYYDLIKFSLNLFEITNGVFDPTIIDILEIIGYGNNPKENVDIKRYIRKRATAKNIFLRALNSKYEIMLTNNARVDMGGIGKGYAVDRAIELARPLGNVMINAGGDIRAFGKSFADGYEQLWKIKLWHPNDVNKYVDLNSEDCITASSGYGKIFSGISHIINPKLVKNDPLEKIIFLSGKYTEIIKNEIIDIRGCLYPCMLCDALSTACYIDPKLSLKFKGIRTLSMVI